MGIHYEPGERFPVDYGTGKQLSSVSLSIRQQKQVMSLLVEGDKGDQLAKMEAAEQALAICFPGITDEQLDSLNYNMSLEVISKALAATRLSVDEQKKSE